MATHVADRILAALKSRMASVPGITGAHLLPLHMLDSSQLPAIVIEQGGATGSGALLPVPQDSQLGHGHVFEGFEHSRICLHGFLQCGIRRRFGTQGSGNRREGCSVINTTYGYMKDFGTTATIGAASVIGIFDSAPVAEFGILGSAPKFLCKASDVPGITFGQAVTIESVSYTVTEVKPDGTGLTELILDKAS